MGTPRTCTSAKASRRHHPIAGKCSGSGGLSITGGGATYSATQQQQQIGGAHTHKENNK